MPYPSNLNPDSLPEGENYDIHWRHFVFKDKVILDIGADYGSTVQYFLSQGASKVIAVENDEVLYKALERNFLFSNQVIIIKQEISNETDLSKLIQKFSPNIIKMDIDFSEANLMRLSSYVLTKVSGWMIEVYDSILETKLETKFKDAGFKVEFKMPPTDTGRKILIAWK